LLAVLFGGCAEPELELPELLLESERARIGFGGGEHSPCSGDLISLDRSVEEVEALTGFRRTEPLEIFLIPDLSEACSGTDLLGCYRPDLDQIFGVWAIVKHEVAHAVEADQIDFGGRVFLSEGHAEVLDGATSWKADTRLTVDGLEAKELTTYLSAHHFARYLVENYGWEAYQEALAAGGFEQRLGISTSELLDEYERNAPAAYPPRQPCPYPELQGEDGSWDESFSFSCGSDEASQYEYGRWSRTEGAAVWRTVELEAGSYGIEVEGGVEALVIGCHTEVLSELPEAPSSGDLWNEVDQRPETAFAAGSVHEFAVTAGTYRVAVSSGVETEATMRLRLWRQ